MDAIRSLLGDRPEAWQPLSDEDREQLVRDYIRDGRHGRVEWAVQIFHSLDREAQARIWTWVMSPTQPDPNQPHPFEPRKFGAKTACWCGATRNDKIHTNRQPWPGDRRDGSGNADPAAADPRSLPGRAGSVDQ